MNDCFDDILDILNNYCNGGQWTLDTYKSNLNLYLYGRFCYTITLDEVELPTLDVCSTYECESLSEQDAYEVAREIMSFASTKIGRMLIGNEYND